MRLRVAVPSSALRLPGLVLVLLLAGCSSPGGDADAASAGNDGVPPPAAEAGVLTGQLTAASPSVELGLPIESEGHGRLAVTLVMAQPVPQTTLRMTVVGPGGREADGATSPFLYALPGAKPTVSFATPEAGSWTARVELSGALGEYEVHWCADDAEAHGPASNLACQRY